MLFGSPMRYLGRGVVLAVVSIVFVAGLSACGVRTDDSSNNNGNTKHTLLQLTTTTAKRR